MNEKWTPLSKDVDEKEVKRRKTWYTGYILGLRKSICKLEEQIQMKKIKIMYLKEDVIELDVILGADE